MMRTFVYTVVILLLAPTVAAKTARPLPARDIERATVQDRRDTFREAWAAARSGNPDVLSGYRAELGDYLLWPYLEGAWISARIERIDDDTVESFLAEFGDLAIADQVRRKYLDALANAGRHRDLLRFYRTQFAGDSNERRRCLALDARLKTGKLRDLADDAVTIWLSPRSLPDACDAVFEYLQAEGHLTMALKRKRLLMALEAGRMSLARYLARDMDRSDLKAVEAWAAMRSLPDRELGRAVKSRDRAFERARVVYGLNRLASRDPDKAARHLETLAAHFSFDRDTVGAVERRIAEWSARKDLDAAASRIRALDPAFRDDAVIAWGVRTALKRRDWTGVLDALDLYPAEIAATDQWRYWRARALEATGDTDAARTLYDTVAAGRGYFAFLAADRLGVDYRFSHLSALPDEAVIERLSRNEALLRAVELKHVSLQGKGRTEWERAVKRLSEHERTQAAILAHRWDWHSRAIRTAVRNKLGNDLEIVYPMPYPTLFERGAESASIPTSWVYGIARSESLFMADVSSHAGALGLMQLMPATGRDTARRAGIRYRGSYSLLNPETNVTLGTTYLGWMYERFGYNRVLATAAYNAGPHRVRAWLPDGAPLAADIWAETIPFTETRRYVRRVLTSEAIFRWRATGRTTRLAALMPPVEPAPTDALALLASTGRSR